MSIIKRVIKYVSQNPARPIEDIDENILIISYKKKRRCVKHYISKRFPSGTIGNFDIADKMEELDIIDVEMIIGEHKTGVIKIPKTAVQQKLTADLFRNSNEENLL